MRATPDGLVDQLVSAIRAKIVVGDCPPGAALRQAALAAEFSVSRTPIREALRTLEAQGLVQVIPNHGAIVRDPNPREISEAYVVRAELEGLAVELAVSYIREGELARLREAEALFRHAVEQAARNHAQANGGPAEWVRANDLFHDVILEAARNDRLRRTVIELHRTFPRNLTWTTLKNDERLLRDNVAEHRRILQAVEDHDAPTARAAMKAHIRRSGELIAAWRASASTGP